MHHFVARAFAPLVSPAVVLLVAVGPAIAGIATSVDQETTATPAGPPATTGVTQDKTVELLLQLQDQQPKTGVTPRRESAAAAPALALPAPSAGTGGTAADAVGVPSLREGLLNEAARFAAEARQEGTANNTRRVESTGEAALPPPSMGAPRPMARDSEPPSILSNPVIRFVRENRVLALGAAVGLLVAVWLTANVSFRSRRR